MCVRSPCCHLRNRRKGQQSRGKKPEAKPDAKRAHFALSKSRPASKCFILQRFQAAAKGSFGGIHAAFVAAAAFASAARFQGEIALNAASQDAHGPAGCDCRWRTAPLRGLFSVLASESRRKTRQNLLLKPTDFSKQSLPFEIASLLQHQKRLAHIMLN